MNESHALGLALKLSPEEVKAIHYPNCPPQECLREVIIKFLQQAPESRRNWSVIADALASPLVNHQALAEAVKATHFLDTRPTNMTPTSSLPTSLAPTSSLPTSPAPTSSPPTSPAPTSSYSDTTDPAPGESTPTSCGSMPVSGKNM